MKRTSYLSAILRLALAAAAAWFALPAAADDACSPLRTINATGSKIWVTVYDLAKLRHLDYGWVDACTVREWRSGTYTCGAYYHVRAEVKNAALTANIYDTEVQVSAQSHPFEPVNPSTAVTLRKGSNNYYWDHGMTVTCDGTGHCGCDQSPAAGQPVVDMQFKNSSYTSVKVHVTAGSQVLKDECVNSAALADWKLPAAASYQVAATLFPGQDCNGGGQAAGSTTAVPQGNHVLVNVISGNLTFQTSSAVLH
jgi:hypothetical protein